MKTRVTIVVMMWIRESMKYQILFNNFESLFLEKVHVVTGTEGAVSGMAVD